MIDERPHIILGMNGVLTDFIGGVGKLFDADLSELNTFKVHKYLGVTPTDLWTKIAEDQYFWAELKPLPWADELVETLRSFDLPITVSTSPSQDPNSAGQKAWWLCSHYPDFARTYLIGPQKHLLAQSNRMLIDDNEVNCHMFKQHGGHSILFPQPWNTKHIPEDRIAFIKQNIELFVQKMNKDDV